MRNGIIAGGNWIVDHIKVIDRWPAQDALASIIREDKSGGGSPYNILKDLAHLGSSIPLAAIGMVGNDEYGRAILRDCQAHGIDTAQMRANPAAPTSYTDVMTVEGNGRRTFFHQRGANAALGPEHFNFASCRAKILHLGYLLLLDRLDELDQGRPRACEVLTRAREAGILTSLDCVSEDGDRFQTIVGPALPYVDVFFANDFETEKLTGIPLRSGGRIDAHAVGLAARNLLDRGVKVWSIIHFPEAVYALGRSGQEVWQASLDMPSAEIVGAAGAGDALAAGVLLGLHEDWPMEECLRLGVCAAAASLSHVSCSEGVGSVDECLALAKRYGYKALPA